MVRAAVHRSGCALALSSIYQPLQREKEIKNKFTKVEKKRVHLRSLKGTMTSLKTKIL